METGMIIKAVCLCLLHSLWQALLLALLSNAILYFGSRLSPVVRYRLLSSCFAGFLLAITVTFFMLYNRLDTLPVAPGIIRSGLAAGSAETQSLTLTAWCIQYSDTIVSVWFILCCLKLLAMIRSVLSVRRLRSRGITALPAEYTAMLARLSGNIGLKRKVWLRQSEKILQPIVTGFFKPLILVPAGMVTRLTTAELEVVLLHELAHIRRNDYLFNLLQCFAETIFFFNPAVYWLSSMIRNEREYCCDAIAVRTVGSKPVFIRALLSFYDNPANGNASLLALSGTMNQLPARVFYVIHGVRSSAGRLEKTALWLGLPFLVLLMAFFFQAPKQREYKAATAVQASRTATKGSAVQNKIGPALTMNLVLRRKERPQVSRNYAGPAGKHAAVQQEDTAKLIVSADYINGFKLGLAFRKNKQDEQRTDTVSAAVVPRAIEERIKWMRETERKEMLRRLNP